MIPPHPDILTVRDAEILRLLRRMVDIGVYRRTFTAEHVAHVVNRWLVPREADVIPLHVVEPEPEPLNIDVQPDAPTVALPAGQYAVIVELLKGRNNRAIAETRGITEDTVKSHLQRVYRVIGVHDRASAISTILSGQVRIELKPNGNRKKAS